ncbi:hypothetical protein O2N63_04315 [Aliiroseovarius sp. KMU-50]|uniref:DUF1127 domain-containing protein n=1 Tax=Aliiroseovarius salicola TaxID=3009082 RepID=A0ABT4VYG9_9RHOB|nr:hypothetical protein [Aliiroseovarius sp. KMU-50]MDA5093305.1 hypothetical protein [Aliiroseovarius sp. KMU-50]
MTYYSDTPQRVGSPAAQVIAALIKRHGRWRVLRAALFAGHPLPRRTKRTAPPQLPDHLRRDLGLPENGSGKYPPPLKDFMW